MNALHFEEDFTFLCELKRFVCEEINRLSKQNSSLADISEGYFTKMKANRSVRVVFPQGLDVLQGLMKSTQDQTDEHLDLKGSEEETDGIGKREKPSPGYTQSSNYAAPLYFVGFVGYQTFNSNLVSTEAWNIDKDLIAELKNHSDILIYSSAEKATGSDWFNLVVFSHTRAINKWRNCEVHCGALRISSDLYDHVRIHRGVMDLGLHSERFGLVRTIFLDYKLPPTDKHHFYVTVWGEQESQSKTFYYCTPEDEEFTR